MTSILVSPYQRADHSLAGFVLSGRWPINTREWTQFLAIAVQFAAQPGFLATTTVFRALDQLPDDPPPSAIGLVASAGPVCGNGAIQAGELADPQPAALIVLHPPTETIPSIPEIIGAASGVLLLPGVPHLGLEHRAGWVEAEADGTLTKLICRFGVDPKDDPDLAVLAALCAA